MAHIPDGFLSGPVLLGATTASAAALGLAARRCRTRLREQQAPLLGALTAFVLAAQMLNFPLGAGTSAHLLGGVLAGVMVGPWAGMLVVFSVVLVQALLLQDGGIAALGANTLNLSLVGAGGGWLLYRWLHLLLGGDRRLLAAGVAAYLTSALTGVAVAVELAMSGTAPLGPALAAVGGGYLLMGVAETALTVGILRAVLRSRPSLLEEVPASSPAARAWTLGLSGAALVLAAATLLASTRPDVFENAVEELGILAPGTVRGVWREGAGPWVSGTAGVAVSFVLGWLLFRIVARRRTT